MAAEQGRSEQAVYRQVYRQALPYRSLARRVTSWTAAPAGWQCQALHDDGYAPGVGAAFPRLRPSTKPIPSPMRSAGTG